MKPTSIAALVAALLAMPVLAACEREEVEYYEALLTGAPLPAPDYAPGSLVIEEIIEAEELVAFVEPEAEPPRYLEIEGEVGTMGEVIATGVDCVPVRWVRICR